MCGRSGLLTNDETRASGLFQENTEGEFPLGGGEMGELVRALDWSKTSLGPISAWPPIFKSTLNLMLPAHAQIVLFWGPEFVALYNDAYAPTIGEKHPRALGRPARENWAELWDDLEPLLRRVLKTGETVFAKDRPFYIERHGYPENVYFDISYSPVWDNSRQGRGVLCIVSETTERVVAQERQRLLLQETNHRLKNLFAMVDAMIGLSSGQPKRHRNSPRLFVVGWLHSCGPRNSSVRGLWARNTQQESGRRWMRSCERFCSHMTTTPLNASVQADPMWWLARRL